MQTRFAEAALAIRQFEHGLLDLHKRGLISGTVHTCVGQENVAIALHPHLRSGIDAFFATHRGHGHFLAHGGEPESLLAEMMGREGALCRGRGGSQHLHFARFFSNGIQAAGCLQAVGYAWALKRFSAGKPTAIAVAQLGDGTLGEGAVYEAMNFAALLKVPVLFLLEYNGWAQSTDVRNTIAGTIEGRAAAFGLPVDRRTDLDVAELETHLATVVDQVRQGQPFLQIVETRRLLAHSKGDDDRTPDLIAAQFAADPLGRWMQANANEASRIEAATSQILAQQIAAVTDRLPIVDLGASALPDLAVPPGSIELVAQASRDNTYGSIVQELNQALHRIMNRDDRVVLLGEDLADPYGGAFKVARGLSSTFGDRVLSTPIAENGIAGIATGAALAGLRPVAEIMFADFVTLAIDQLINSAAKFHYMFGGKVTCPLTLRLVSGGGRGYGPTHSQSPERLLCGEPGLRVVAVSQRHDPAALLQHVVLHDDAPTVFVEDKSLYGLKPLTTAPLAMQFQPQPGNASSYPPLIYEPRDEHASVTVVSYGRAAQLAEQALRDLALEHEMFGDLIILTQLWPLDASAVIASAGRTGRLMVVEPHVATYGISAAVISSASTGLDRQLITRAVGARPLPIPSTRHLEDQVLPSLSDVKRALSQLLRIS